MAVSRGSIFFGVVLLLLGILLVVLALAVQSGVPEQQTALLGPGIGGMGLGSIQGAMQDPGIGTWKISQVVTSDQLVPDPDYYNTYNFIFDASKYLRVTMDGIEYANISYQRVAYSGPGGVACLGNMSYPISDGYSTRSSAKSDNLLIPDYFWLIDGKLYGCNVANGEFRVTKLLTKVA